MVEKIPSFREHGIVNRVTETPFAYQGWPSVTKDENGTLYAVSSSFRAQHVCPFGKTAMYISRNNGKTWTPPIVINDTWLDDRDAGILYLGNGRLLVTWFTHPTQAYLTTYYEYIRDETGTNPEAAAVMGMLEGYKLYNEKQDKSGSFIRISEDYGVTWSKTIKIPVSAPHGPNLLSDGTLFYLGKEMYSNGLEEPGAIAAYVSLDGGYTWERRGLCEKPEGLPWGCFCEPHIVELPDGTILGAMRSGVRENKPYFSVYTTTSRDQGRTWSVWRFVGVSGSPPHLMRHSSGAIICSVGRREPPYGERAIISYDNGETWQDEYIINDRANEGDLGYPCSVELTDGSILTVYYQRWMDENGNFDPKCSILYTNWRLDQRTI